MLMGTTTHSSPWTSRGTLAFAGRAPRRASTRAARGAPPIRHSRGFSARGSQGTLDHHAHTLFSDARAARRRCFSGNGFLASSRISSIPSPVNCENPPPAALTPRVLPSPPSEVPEHIIKPAPILPAVLPAPAHPRVCLRRMRCAMSVH